MLIPLTKHAGNLNMANSVDVILGADLQLLWLFGNDGARLCDGDSWVQGIDVAGDGQDVPGGERAKGRIEQADGKSLY